jgi:hypothetical protein
MNMPEPKKKMPDEEFKIHEEPKVHIGPRIEIMRADQVPPELASLLMSKAMNSEEGVWALYDLLHTGGYENIANILINESSYNKENPKEFISRVGNASSDITEYFLKQTPKLTLGEMELTLITVIMMMYKMHSNSTKKEHNCKVCLIRDICPGNKDK